MTEVKHDAVGNLCVRVTAFEQKCDCIREGRCYDQFYNVGVPRLNVKRNMSLIFQDSPANPALRQHSKLSRQTK